MNSLLKQLPRPLGLSRGFSLVELMVALLLGAVITLGITTMFSGNQAAYQVVQGQSRLQENARFAMDFISRPLRMAGFTGCISYDVDLYNVLDVADPSDIPFEFQAGTGLTGHEATSATTWSPVLDTLPADIDTDEITPETDLLVIRATIGDSLSFTRGQENPAAALKTTLPANEDLYSPGTIVLVSDCTKATLFQITQSGQITQAGELAFNVVHNTGAQVPGNFTKNLTPDGTVYGKESFIYQVVTSVFWIAPSAGTNNRGNPVQALWYKEGTAAPVELIEGVEDLQVLYGVDTTGDRVPNRYRTINNIAADDYRNIVTVRVTMTLNSVDVVTDQTADGLLRRTFSQTIALRNRLA